MSLDTEFKYFYPKKLLALRNMGWIRDLGSGKNLSRILDPGVQKKPDLGSRIRIRYTG